MKKVLLMPVLGALVLLVSCKQIDKELVSSIQADQAKIKEAIPSFQTNAALATSLVNRMDQAPVELKASQKLNFAELYSSAQAIVNKYQAIIQIYSDLNTKLDSLNNNYVDGDLTKEDVKAGRDAMAQELEVLPKVQDRVVPFMQKTIADYDQMLKDWDALPAADKVLRPTTSGVSVASDAANTKMMPTRSAPTKTDRDGGN